MLQFDGQGQLEGIAPGQGSLNDMMTSKAVSRSSQHPNILTRHSAGQAAMDAGEVAMGVVDTRGRISALPIPGPLEQLWAILRQAPPNMQYIQLASSRLLGTAGPGVTAPAACWIACCSVFETCQSTLQSHSYHY